MARLAEMKCTVCREGDIPLSREEIAEQHQEVADWEAVQDAGVDKLKRTYKFDDFASALAFTNAIGQIAEDEGHHPILITQWGKVTVTWWTHKIDGLHQNDFIMAARSDKAYKEGLFEKSS